MDESDEDFKELCASFFQRVRKNGPKDVSGERKRQRASHSARTRSTLPRTKPTATTSTPAAGPPGRKGRPGSRAPGNKQPAPAPTRGQEHGPAPPEDGEGGAPAPAAAPPESTTCTQTEGAPSSGPRAPPSCWAATGPSPSRRTAELVLQRMQRFKRAAPRRLTHSSPRGPLEAALLGAAAAATGPHEGTTAGPGSSGSGPGLPVTGSDAAGQGGSLEEKGLFFCQLCQKDLSAMNVTRREQHVNRCLDEAEKTARPSAPQIPECPICGKPFLTPKSRTSHLKQCAARMEVGPQLLLQAVRLQNAQPAGAPAAPAPSASSLGGGLKRKAAPGRKEPQKRRRVSGPEAPSEDLLVAMALSRSELEAGPAALGPGCEWLRLGAEKKSRKKRAAPPPRLLVQDAETTGRQIEDRVAQLLAEEAEVASTPPLPAGRRLGEEMERASWRLCPPTGKRNPLWEGSALTQAWAPDAFYTASLVPPLEPQRPSTAPTQEPARPPAPPGQPEPGPGTLGPSASQREHQALQDLVDLAGEGLGASPEGAAEVGSSPGSLPLTGFVLPAEETQLEAASQDTLSLSLLVADLGAMVNNPQLSDVQLQMDSGELLHAHKFVLYARCPLLMQHVNSEGFCAAEDGGPPIQRVLLSDVRVEAARAFLHYLYTADTRPPPQLAPDLASLARRFGVRELAWLCERASAAPDTEGSRQEGQGERGCESRAENFHELLRAVWAGEEEAEAPLKPENCGDDAEKVDEAEMEDIYEFAATQRQLRRGAAPGVEEESRPLADSPGGVQAAQMDSPGPGGGQTLGVGSSVRPCSGLLPGAQRLDGEEGGEHPPGAPGPASPTGPPRGRGAEKEAAAFLLSGDADGAEQPFLLTQGRHPQTPQASSVGEDGSRPGGPRGSGRPPTSPCPHRPSQAPPQGASPRWPQPCPPLADGPAPLAPQSPQAPHSPAQRRRGRLGPSPGAPGCQEGQRQASLLGCRGAGVLVSPQKPLSIDLTQPQPSRTCSRPQSPPGRGSRGHEVVILLDSDEEPEPQQPPAQAARDPPEDRKVLEVSANSCELFPVIDVDTDPGSAGARGPPRPLCGPECSPGEDSSSDASWLVPATPLAVRNRNASSQTQVLGLGSRLADGRAASLKPSASSEQRGSPEAVAKAPVPSPRTSASGLAPEAPGSGSGGRRLCGSPGSAPPRGRRSSAPPGRLPGTHQQPQPCWPPRPSAARPAPAGEVVEVEDSGDEQEGGSGRARGSPLLDGKPPVPAGDHCWRAEPLSPVPIGHLDRECSGPLGTSSPSGGDHRAPPPLGATPIRGSCPGPGRRRPWEASPGASPLGGSERSFLNSALWDSWDSSEEQPPGPCPQGPPAGPTTPGGAGRKDLPPKVPITPMPRYSILETPELKKELDRFGVRPLPKRQMVLKLKEIFQYTHQTLESDAEEASAPAPGPGRQAPGPEATPAAGRAAPGAALGLAPRRSRGPQPRQQQPGGGVPAPSTTPAELPASQRSAASSADGSDSSSGSQSSASCEFGLALESAGDEEREEGAGASQAAATEAALRRYIRSRPALYRRVLQYRPLELAELRAGLRQQGVRAAAGALLDFLDAQCITFTTAAARKEQLSRRRRPAGRRKATGGARPGGTPPRP